MSVDFNQLSFDEVFLHYKEKFIGFAISYVGHRQAAEDIVVDAFMTYWENRGRLAADTNIPAYVLTVVKNRCLTWLRDRKLHEDILDKMARREQWRVQMQIASLESLEPHHIFTQEMQATVRHTLNLLPEKTRQVFLMSRYQHKSHKEIAGLLGISLKTVEFHITKATKVLRERLKDYSFLLFFI
ncbi:MAG: RNA polymerase sigma-70 factor [Bacteroides sp.]|nr:RNA polymerase sigma-70 factor [Bacteroides sp.]